MNQLKRICNYGNPKPNMRRIKPIRSSELLAFCDVVVSLVKTDRVPTDRKKERKQARKKEFAMGSFKRTHTAEERAAEAARMRLKYPDRIPVIVEKASHTDMPDMDKNKFLVPEEVTVGQFVHIIGKRLHLRAGQALFVFVGNVLPPTASLLASIYHEYKDADGFLYISYSGEKTFG
ncbi:unnamed protein product [Sphagnum tenellum]